MRSQLEIAEEIFIRVVSNYYAGIIDEQEAKELVIEILKESEL